MTRAVSDAFIRRANWLFGAWCGGFVCSYRSFKPRVKRLTRLRSNSCGVHAGGLSSYVFPRVSDRRSIFKRRCPFADYVRVSVCVWGGGWAEPVCARMSACGYAPASLVLSPVCVCVRVCACMRAHAMRACVRVCVCVCVCPLSVVFKARNRSHTNSKNPASRVHVSSCAVICRVIRSFHASVQPHRSHHDNERAMAQQCSDAARDAGSAVPRLASLQSLGKSYFVAKCNVVETLVGR